MRVVSNTTPLNYLVLIGEADLLAELFGRVVIPEAVSRELADPRAPAEVRNWVVAPPAWLDVQAAPTPPDSDLADLHAGEREAIALALEIGADLLLVDESGGRRVAGHRGIAIAGTLGVLDRAAERGLINFRQAVELLRHTTFRVSEAVLQPLLDRHDRADSV
jgi:predicted nucleic acid-binding protein